MEVPIKPADFLYHRPETRIEAIELLAKFGEESKILAGGQSLMPMLNMRLVMPEHLIDINRIRDFGPLEVIDGALQMGACVRQRDVEVAPVTRSTLRILTDALAFVGHRAIRDRGTIIGSLTHADPSAELPAVLLLLGGTVTAEGPMGSRSIPARDFFQGVFETALRSDEMATAVTFPQLKSEEGWAFEEIARRKGDFALCGVAAIVGARSARLVLFGTGTVPRLFDVSDVVNGDVSLEDRLADLDPLSDIHASAEYRRHLASVLGERALRIAERRRPSGERRQRWLRTETA